MVASDSFHVAFWNLIFGGISVCCLLMSHSSTDAITLSFQVDSFLMSPESKHAGVALLVSSIPLLIDICVTLVNKNRFRTDDGILVGRIYYAIPTFLFGLQLTLQHDMFQYVPNYETNLMVLLLCYRIVLASSLNFFVCITADQNNNNICIQGFQTIVSTMLFCLTSSMNILKSDCVLHGIKLKEVSLVLYLLFGMLCFIQQILSHISFTNFLYMCIHYLTGTFTIAILFLNSYLTKSSYIWNYLPLISIYMSVFIAVLLVLIPGWIASYNAAQFQNEIAVMKIAYHRYMSHELRNPMNIADMGIQFCLNKIPQNTADLDLQGIRDTLEEVKVACDDNLTILNDFILYDNLENEQVKLKISVVNVMDLINEHLAMLKIQIRIKNIKLELNNSDFECTTSSYKNSNHFPTNFAKCTKFSSKSTSTSEYSYFMFTNGECINESDVILVDESKFGQVLRNLMSVIVKLTPNNGIIGFNIVFVPDELTKQSSMLSSSSSSNLLLSYFGKLEEIDSIDKRQNGRLVIEIQDSVTTQVTGPPKLKGSRYPSQRRRKEIVPFNPETIQAGGAKGLCLWISEAIVDMHKGTKLSVFCGVGEDEGSTFRLEIPMTRTHMSTNTSFVTQISKSMNTMDSVYSLASMATNSSDSLMAMAPTTATTSTSTTSSTNIPYIQVVHGKDSESEASTASTNSTNDVNSKQTQKIEEPSNTSTVTSILSETALVITPCSNIVDRALSSTSATQTSEYKIRSSTEIRPTVVISETTSTNVANIESLHVHTSGGIFEQEHTSVTHLYNGDDVAVNTCVTDLDYHIGTIEEVMTTEMPAMSQSSFANVTPPIARYIDIGVSSEALNKNRTKRFLIVDDVATNRKMLRKLLEQKGHICEEAGDGIIALRMLNENGQVPYDAIFMDYVMPNMNGPDATRAIRELGYKGLIVGVTGNSHDDDQEYFMNAGLTYIIIKPLKMNKLSEIMDI